MRVFLQIRRSLNATKPRAHYWTNGSNIIPWMTLHWTYAQMNIKNTNITVGPSIPIPFTSFNPMAVTHYKAFIQSLGLDEHRLMDGLLYLDTLTDIAEVLGVHDVSLTGMTLTLDDLLDSLHNEERLHAQNTLTLHRLDRSVSELRTQVQLTSALTDRFQGSAMKVKQKTGEWTRHSHLLDQKRQQYVQRLAGLDKDMNDRRVAECRVESIKALQQTLEQRRSMVRERQQLLSVYQGLPADVDLARLELEEKKQCLRDLEVQRQVQLRQMAAEL